MKKALIFSLVLSVVLVILSGCFKNTSSGNEEKTEIQNNVSSETGSDNTDTVLKTNITRENVDMDNILTKFDKNLLSDYDYSKFKNKNITLNVCNWGEYMAVNEEDYLDVNKEFEKLTGIKVNYKTFATNEELYSKLKSGGGDYDIVVPSDYMISKMINEGLIQKLDYSNIPNFGYIDKKYVGL